MNRSLSDKTRKVFFIAVLMISYIAILVFNILTPIMSDDFIQPQSYESIKALLAYEYDNYMNWNGRSIVQLIMHIFCTVPKGVFNILNSACFVYLTLLIYWNIDRRKKYDFVLLTFINLLLWNFSVDFGQTVLWLGGACNYLWGASLIMTMVTFYRYKVEHPETVKHPIALCAVLFLTGILGGWSNENSSGGGLLLVLFTAFMFYKENKKLTSWMISGIAGMCLGLFVMVMAPANQVRGAVEREQERHTGIMAIVARFLKINNAVESYFFPLIIMAILLLTYFIIKKMDIQKLLFPLMCIFSCIATSYVLIFTPQPMPRAYFCAGIFLTIAVVQLVAYIPSEDVYMNTIKYGGITVFVVFAYFSYCTNGADLMRIYREVNEREVYIEQQKALGNYDLVVPMIRSEFDNKYSFMIRNDLNENPESWGCVIHKEYYGLNSIVGVPREEWTEY